MPLELETINGRNTSRWLKNERVKTEDIVIILFDDKSRFLLRRDGVPVKDFEKKERGLIKDAIEKLNSNGVQTIGLNLNLTASSDSKIDEELGKTIASLKNVVIANPIYSAAKGDIVLNSARSVGYGELLADYDKVVHKIKLVDKEYAGVGSFAYELFKIVTKSDVNQALKKVNELYLRYPQDLFKTYSFVDLIQGKIKQTELKNKIVIVGVGLKSKLFKDELLSPFGQSLLDSDVQAVAVTNLLSNSYLIKLSLTKKPLLFILFSIIFGAIFSNLPAFRGLVLSICIFISLVVFSQFIYSHSNFLVELVPFLFLLFGNFLIGSLVFLQLNLQDRNIELESALHKLKESQVELKDRNTELSIALSELNKKIIELKGVRKQLANKSEEERKRIARELHDDTLARITDLKRHIESIIYSKDLPVVEKKQLGASIQTLDNVTSEVRRIINALRPSMLDNALGLLPAIENLLDDLSKRSGYRIQTKLVTSLSKLKINESCEIHLYRIMQEALNNVFKHSSATKLEVKVQEQPGQILILVSDNGIGFKPGQEKKGFGLIDMKERADLISAHIQYLNKPESAGTTLEIILPVKDWTFIEKKETTGIVV